MKRNTPQAARRRTLSGWLASALAATVAAVMVAVTPTQALAIATPVPLGTAASFSVLAGTEVTNTGPSVIDHDLGVHPGTAISGFPPGVVLGEIHSADAVAQQAKSDLVQAYNNAAGQATDFALPAQIGNGDTLLPGVHTAVSGVGLTGDLILDAGGNPNAVWVFQIPEALTTASSSRVLLTNGASACNVYWQIGSSATLGTNSTFVGTIMALTSISVTTGTNIEGRALARNGAVTLDTNRIFLGECATNGGTTSGTTNGGTTTGTTNGGTTTGTTTGGTTTGVTSGGVLGGPIVSIVGGSTSGNTSGNTQGNTSGNTAGNTAGNTTGGNTQGNTAGNATSGNTQGNSAGNTTGGHGHKPGKPGKPDHGGKPGWPGHHDRPGGPDHGGKPGHGHGEGPGKPGHGHGEGPGKPGHGHEEGPGKPGHGEGHDAYSYGYGDKPATHKG
ncbi:ice-binding family protein [Streptomyces flavidovirens]|uniref:Ice-binding family protein n=1 Tax=Streptomyces flavidovirens TaxID=67298 RepID=A0ABW6RN36_9ACTN